MTDQPYTIMIGDTEVTIFDDGHFVLPAAYFGNVPDAIELEDTVEIGANLWVLKNGERLILVDTGSADALKARFPQTGMAWPSLQGIAPTDIVLTHMHADHIGGFMDPASFADATIHVSRAEWEFWTNPALVNAVPEDNRPMVQMIQSVADGIKDRVKLHDGAGELAPGIAFVPLPGHTPGHSGLRLHGDSGDLVIVADAIISAAMQFTAPSVTYALDGDADAAVATRRALLQSAATDGTMIAATHFAFPGLGTVSQEGDAFRFSAV